MALVWPAKPGANREPELSEVVDALLGATRAEVQRLIEGWLDALNAQERWALLKLLTGGLRVGVSARMAKQACADLGLRSRRMVSRAYHDSLFMARICPTTMIFIPCRNGWSHRPEEYASPEHIASGVEVLAHTLARLAV